MIPEHPIIFPAHTQIQRQPAVDLPIVLDKGGDIVLTVAMNNALRTAAYAEQTGKECANRRAVGIARVAGAATRRGASGPPQEKIVKTIDEQKSREQRRE